MRSRGAVPEGNHKKRTDHAWPSAGLLDVPPYEPFSQSLFSTAPQFADRRSALSVRGGVTPGAETVIYIHGIGNKPTSDVLKCQWDTALFNAPMGDRTRMAYWVNRAYYPEPVDETCASKDTVRLGDNEVSTRSVMALSGERHTDDDPVEAEIRSLTSHPQRRDWLRSVARSLEAQSHWGPELELSGFAASDSEGDIRTSDFRVKVLPLPPVLRRLITQRITRAYLRDVNDFFFDPQRRQTMEESLLDRIRVGGGPFVVISHSQGTMIAYNVLRQLEKAQCDVRLFVTMGSPLGIAEVQDIFKNWIPADEIIDGKLPFPKCVQRWVNVADILDPVAADHNLNGDFAGEIENYARLLLNPDSPRDPHSGTGYLRTSWVKEAVRDTVGNAFAQATGRFVIAKDLAGAMERSWRDERHRILIQLGTGDSHVVGANAPNLNSMRGTVRGAIENMLHKSQESPEVAEIEEMKRFVAARLTRSEIEQLKSGFSFLTIEKIWRDASKSALIVDSTNTVQARPANRGYGALGQDIGWAVLDTGIRADHPHFHKFQNVKTQWDCTHLGPVRECDKRTSETLDGHGHGTHVAGIIAGFRKMPTGIDGEYEIFEGMAPRASLYGFKVLDDRGEGRDSWIIKGLDRVAEINEEAGHLVIHGINLSLGGSFDPSIYGCGHTPLCEELRRLWGQGVLVCLAAGNEGYTLLQGSSGIIPVNLDLTIGDPANLQEAIAVGSVHKTNPHTYGISYFSSRGPTADGRMKPDLVAPGEQILSAYHDWKKLATKSNSKLTVSDLYIEMSGTSMACPHVSGILAAYLSMRREFIGYPDRVKAALLQHCTDLGRDPYFQGRGLPNLVKMLANS